MGFFLILLSLALYLLPAIVALIRGHHQTLAIFMLDLLTAWTFVGWVLALVWATTAVRKEAEA